MATKSRGGLVAAAVIVAIGIGYGASQNAKQDHPTPAFEVSGPSVTATSAGACIDASEGSRLSNHAVREFSLAKDAVVNGNTSLAAIHMRTASQDYRQIGDLFGTASPAIQAIEYRVSVTLDTVATQTEVGAINDAVQNVNRATALIQRGTRMLNQLVASGAVTDCG